MSRSNNNMTLMDFFLKNQIKKKKFTLKTGLVGAGLGFMYWIISGESNGESRSSNGAFRSFNVTSHSSNGESHSRSPAYLFLFILAGSMLLMGVTTASNLYHAWKTFPEEKKFRARREQRYRAILDYKQGADDVLNEVRALLAEKRESIIRLSQPIEEFKYPNNSQAAAIDRALSAMQDKVSEELITNKGWKCVITQQLFRDPVKANDGFFYERHALQRWYDLEKRNCIINREKELSNPKMLPTHLQMQNEILEYLYSLSPPISLVTRP